MTITDDYIFFYGFDWPSNFTTSPMVVPDDFWSPTLIPDPEEHHPELAHFKTAEAYYQSRKAVMAGDVHRYYEIMLAKTPGETKKIARDIKLDSKIWNRNRVKYMWETLNLKFSQNPDLMKLLLDERLDGKKFVEASPTDTFWGCGKSEESVMRIIEMKEDPLEFDFKKDLPSCMNMLGELLTKLRSNELKKKG